MKSAPGAVPSKTTRRDMPCQMLDRDPSGLRKDLHQISEKNQ